MSDLNRDLKILKRRHIRAPLRNFFLYDTENHVHKGKTLNISEGGILLSELPLMPKESVVKMVLDIPQYPDISKLGTETVLNMKDYRDFGRKIIKLKAKIVRNFKGMSEVEKIFVDNIGCQFVDETEENKVIIKDYVTQYARNIVHLLNLFEGSSQSAPEHVRKVAYILGYRNIEKLALLRQKILHDYQSLESL